MGLEAIAIAGLAVTAASAIGQAKARRKIESGQKEGNAVNTATGNINNSIARRRAAREARIRIQRLRANARATGTSDSSGLLGATAAIGSNLGIEIAQQRTAEKAAKGLSAANQRISDGQSDSAQIKELTELGRTGLKIASGL